MFVASNKFNKIVSPGILDCPALLFTILRSKLMTCFNYQT